MAATHFKLTGRITRNDTQQGVHGRRVEAWDAEQSSERPLGVALTNRDGSYHIDLRGDGDDRPAAIARDVYIKLRDRDCRLIYDGCADRRCCEPGKPLRIDVALAPQALWWHLSRPLSWERIDEPLVPNASCRRSRTRSSCCSSRRAARLASLKLAVCATPPIEGFDRLLQDAWGALQGDQHAAQRYRDVLDASVRDGGGLLRRASAVRRRSGRAFRRAPARSRCHATARSPILAHRAATVRKGVALAAPSSSPTTRCCCSRWRRSTWPAASRRLPSATCRFCSARFAASRRSARCTPHR